MKILQILMFSLSMMLVAQTQAANNWHHITTGSEHKIYLNIPSVQENKNYNSVYVQAWTRWVIYNDLTKDGMTVGDYTMTLYKVDCNAKKMGIVSQTDYKNSKVFGRSYNPSYVEMSHLIPDTLGESIATDICYANEIIQGHISVDHD